MFWNASVSATKWWIVCRTCRTNKVAPPCACARELVACHIVWILWGSTCIGKVAHRYVYTCEFGDCDIAWTTWDRPYTGTALRRSGRICGVEDDQSGQTMRSTCRIWTASHLRMNDVNLKPVFHSRISPPLAENLIPCSFAPSEKGLTKVERFQQLERRNKFLQRRMNVKTWFPWQCMATAK